MPELTKIAIYCFLKLYLAHIFQTFLYTYLDQEFPLIIEIHLKTENLSFKIFGLYEGNIARNHFYTIKMASIAI